MSLLSFLTGHGGRVIVVITKADTLMQSLTSYMAASWKAIMKSLSVFVLLYVF